MGTIRPPTRTPGSLKLKYTKNGLQHTCSVNFLANIDINDIAARRVNANELAALVQAVSTNTTFITDWSLYTRPGAVGPPTLIYTEPFSPVIQGTFGHVTGARDYLSLTTTVTGQGTPGAPGYTTGPCRMVVFIGDGIFPLPGSKTIASNITPQWDAMITGLAQSTSFWADFYGQKAMPHINMPVQWNAHVQRVHGS